MKEAKLKRFIYMTSHKDKAAGIAGRLVVFRSSGWEEVVTQGVLEGGLCLSFFAMCHVAS